MNIEKEFLEELQKLGRHTDLPNKRDTVRVGTAIKAFKKIVSRFGVPVIKKICVHKWNEKSQAYFEVKLLSELVTNQGIIPNKDERMWLEKLNVNCQYEVDDVSYYYSTKEFTIDIYVKEV